RVAYRLAARTATARPTHYPATARSASAARPLAQSEQRASALAVRPFLLIGAAGCASCTSRSAAITFGRATGLARPPKHPAHGALHRAGPGQVQELLAIGVAGAAAPRSRPFRTIQV